MVRDHKWLLGIVGKGGGKAISYSQLKRILKSFDWSEFNSANVEFFGKEVACDGLSWKAIDGKELRGTIDKAIGQKRSENIIQQVEHSGNGALPIGFYNGSKESEKTVVKDFVDEQESFVGMGLSFDALHTNAELLSMITGKQGVYLAQVKENQKELLQECKHVYEHLPSSFEFSQEEKGHGRIEKRLGKIYTFDWQSLEKCWEGSQMKVLVVVERERQQVKTGKCSNETSYYVANMELSPESAYELFVAVREHWSVESDNNVRDTNFGEDHIQSFDPNTSRTMAICITWALNLLRRKNKDNNIKALREDIANDRQMIFSIFEPE